MGALGGVLQQIGQQHAAFCQGHAGHLAGVDADKQHLPARPRVGLHQRPLHRGNGLSLGLGVIGIAQEKPRVQGIVHCAEVLHAALPGFG